MSEQTSKTDATFVKAMRNKIVRGIKRAIELVKDFFVATGEEGTVKESGAERRFNKKMKEHPIATLLVTFAVFTAVFFAFSYVTTVALGALVAAVPAITIWMAAHTTTAIFASYAIGVALALVEINVGTAVAIWTVPAVMFVGAKFLHLLSKVVKVVMDVVTFVFSLVSNAIALVAIALAGVLGLVGAGLSLIVTFFHKVLWGISLILQTPSLLVQGNDCAKTDWAAYLHSWKPRNFHVTTMADVILQETRDEAALMYRLDIVEIDTDDEVKSAGKGRPTPKQRVTRPHFRSIIPTDFGGVSGMAV